MVDKMKSPVLFAFLVLVLLCEGCVSNLQNFNSTINCPEEQVFDAPFDKTMHAVEQAVLAISAIDEINRERGIIVSILKEIDGRKFNNVIEKAFFGIDYKFSYHIRMFPESGGRTRINTQVYLVYEKFAGLEQYQTHWTEVEHYLRDKLYRKICVNLFHEGNGSCGSVVLEPSSGNATSRMPVWSTNRRRPVRHADPKVKFAQQILGANGYDPGPVDGLLGKRTENALRAFQTENNFPVTGRVDERTYELLKVVARGGDSGDSGSVKKAKPEPPSVMARPKRKKPVYQKAAGQSPYVKPLPPLKKPVDESPVRINRKKVIGKYVTTDQTDLLKEEDLYGSDILATIPANTVLKVIGKDSEYYRVRYRGKEGYVYTEFVEEQ